MGRTLGGFVAIWVLAVASLRLFAVPPERCPPSDAATLTASADAAVAWMVRNQEADGRWLYAYDAERSEAIDDYNVVRHAGVMMSLYQAAAQRDDLDALRSADAGLVWALERMVDANGGRALSDGVSRVPTGASSLLLAALTWRLDADGLAPDDGGTGPSSTGATGPGSAATEADAIASGNAAATEALMEDLARFLAGQQLDDGAILAEWDPATGMAVPERRSPYFTGETSWAWARMATRVDDGEEWNDRAHRTLHYLANDRDVVEPLFPPNDDHWAAYTLAELAPDGLTDAEVDYLERLGGLWSSMTRFDGQRTEDLPWVLTRGEPDRGGWQGTVTEGSGALWRAAAAAGLDDLEPDLAERARCSAGLLAAKQVGAEEVEDEPDASQRAGAWFDDGITRMDIQQHAASGLLGVADLVTTNDVADGDGGIGVAPALLTAAAVLACVRRREVTAVVTSLQGASPNHARGAGSSRSTAVLAAALVAAGASWVAVAIAAPAALDALDVSATTLALGAGVLVLVSALYRVVQRRWGRDGAEERPRRAPLAAAILAWTLLVTPAPTITIAALAARSGAAGALAGALVALVALGVVARPTAEAPGATPRSHLALVTGAVAACELVLIGIVGL